METVMEPDGRLKVGWFRMTDVGCSPSNKRSVVLKREVDGGWSLRWYSHRGALPVPALHHPQQKDIDWLFDLLDKGALRYRVVLERVDYPWVDGVELVAWLDTCDGVTCLKLALTWNGDSDGEQTYGPDQIADLVAFLRLAGCHSAPAAPAFGL